MSEAGVATPETEAGVLAVPRPILSVRRRVLVTGASGMLGSDLVPVLAGAGFEVFPRPRAELDITDARRVASTFRDLRPDVVVNCAAFTKVDACETDPRAFQVNAEGVRLLARECEIRSAQLVQISTDFVFDGEKGSPYAEDDPPAPLSAYGRSKRVGEQAALRLSAGLVVRASWLFGLGGWNFVEAILKQVEEEGQRELGVVSDQRGRPTATTDLSEAIVTLVLAGAVGIYHFANRGDVSWFEFAGEILFLAGKSGVAVRAVRSESLARPARRPAYSVLDTGRYEKVTGRAIRDFREPLAEYLARRARPEA
jgi:dTDP-4-dehydrorhamnose reductase